MNVRSSFARKTIGRAVEISGMGVTTGRKISVVLRPYEEGIVFRRSDIGADIQLSPAAARLGPSWSAVAKEGAEVRIVEHLLACLAAAGVTDILIETNGPELPLFDGSPQPWWSLLMDAGVVEMNGGIEPIIVQTAHTIDDASKGQLLTALPFDRWHLVYVLDWPHPMVGLQSARFTVAASDFGAELAPARTFTLEDDARRAKEAGLFPGGSEDNLIVVYSDRLSSPPALPDAFARHKLVDLLGDLYLFGRPLVGLFVAYNSGHRLNHELVKKLAETEKQSR